MIIIGLDLSLSGTGACKLDTEKQTMNTNFFGTDSKQTRLPRLPDERWEMERFGRTLSHVKCFATGAIEDERPDLVVIEEFAFGIQGAGARSNAGFGYLVRYWLYAVAKIPFLLVGNAQLKKFAVGKSAEKGIDKKMHGVPKEVVIREVFNLWGATIDNNNEADAFVLAKIGEAIMDGYAPSPKATAAVVGAQKNVIATLTRENKWLEYLSASLTVKP